MRLPQLLYGRIFMRTKAMLTSPASIPFLETSAPVLKKSPEGKRLVREFLTRPGLIGVKRGMVSFYNEATGEKYPATVLEIDQVEVVHNKTLSKDGYIAAQVGYGFKVKNQTKSLLGHYATAKVSPKEKLVEFQLREESQLLPVGTQLKADLFEIGQLVDVQGVTKGKGFAGVMKRWGFSGLPASHGVSLAHRSAGSTGQNTSPARVLPGKKMAGRMGAIHNTIKNLEVLDCSAENGYIVVKGHVSGPKGSYVKIQDAKSTLRP
ncbi:unnamed protein product [Kuraishia capsulata CBS 1993]|uniref:Large ribosomal subunit protein uL3m n=1 Tax=Kuraishia capsulata CBS 1993 TaxID=1382522 RepID=W6MQI3_9ASCO|nr:uncharacterized protein KUCA_T00004985001 [Kuraishia capsulata CBS 1993]CDK28999.1 unnamed protein product [Kuraishia capsulata CBS 1993]